MAIGADCAGEFNLPLSGADPLVYGLVCASPPDPLRTAGRNRLLSPARSAI